MVVEIMRRSAFKVLRSVRTATKVSLSGARAKSRERLQGHLHEPGRGGGKRSLDLTLRKGDYIDLAAFLFITTEQY